MTIKIITPRFEKIIQPDRIGLRPHHLLCLPGYKGFGYTAEHKTNWDFISEILKMERNTQIVITTSQDALCMDCPGGKGVAKCNKEFVLGLDKKIQEFLGLITHQTYIYQEIMQELFAKMTPQKHEELCSDCGWWKQGLCRDTFERNR